MKSIRVFYQIFQFLEIKFSIYLNRLVFVMKSGTINERSVFESLKFYYTRYIFYHILQQRQRL